jgi:hypothetical protein
VIHPLTRVYRLTLPFFTLTWMRPEGVQVSDSGGKLQLVRVEDRTRKLLVALTALISLTGWIMLKGLRGSR